MMINFEKGYVFGKRIDGRYLLSKCEPLENCRFGIVKYKYQNSTYLRITPHELEMLNAGNIQWIDHEHQIGNDNNLRFGKTIGEAIQNYKEAFGEIPYIVDEEAIVVDDSYVPLNEMNAEDLNSRITDDNIDLISMRDDNLDDITYLSE